MAALCSENHLFFISDAAILRPHTLSFMVSPHDSLPHVPLQAQRCKWHDCFQPLLLQNHFQFRRPITTKCCASWNRGKGSNIFFWVNLGQILLIRSNSCFENLPAENLWTLLKSVVVILSPASNRIVVFEQRICVVFVYFSYKLNLNWGSLASLGQHNKLQPILTFMT